MSHHLIINILQADWYLIAPFFIAEETEVQINSTNHIAKKKQSKDPNTGLSNILVTKIPSN